MILEDVYLLLIITISVSYISKSISEKPSDEKHLSKTFLVQICCKNVFLKESESAHIENLFPAS
jgi:hypothetical protein